MTIPAFQSILVANRGEIALRIMRTARRLGFRTIAVYSDADRDAPHVRAADAAVPIGAAAPAASYLNISALLDAAARSRADAVHPGYGFLAENADFAQAVVDAGLVFIGPPAPAIRAMGHKAGAKRLMAAAGVPCLAGYAGDEQSDARLREEAARIGYPVMIKAAAGGGGRGMRQVMRAADFPAALRSARSEAEHAFGNGELILEQAIVAPRHIEIQVFADAHGAVVHLGERDCSVQRRHQKLIEESPSPAVSPALRARMGEVSVAATRSIEYRGAGTLEFLLDGNGQFHFMEMNTRLQVEHAVTEAVLDVDLVEWQLRVAGGEALPLTQSDIDARLAQGGHALEARLCAEDPQRDFLPQSGTLARWRAPGAVRTDHALESGITISPYYDSMLAKLVAHGPSRDDALRQLAHAFEECVLLGVTSNRHFLSLCVAHPEFVAGRATTAFIDAQFPLAKRAPAPNDDVVRAIAAVGLLRLRILRSKGRYPDELRGWASSDPYAQICRFELDGEPVESRAALRRDALWEIVQLDVRMTVRVDAATDEDITLNLDGRVYRVACAVGADAWYFVLAGIEHRAQDATYAAASRVSQAVGSGRITAPINGRVVALEVQPGDTVRSGQVLLVVEAMKMEHSIAAPLAGRISGVFAAVDDQVAPGQLLVEIGALPLD